MYLGILQIQHFNISLLTILGVDSASLLKNSLVFSSDDKNNASADDDDNEEEEDSSNDINLSSSNDISVETVKRLLGLIFSSNFNIKIEVQNFRCR